MNLSIPSYEQDPITTALVATMREQAGQAVAAHAERRRIEQAFHQAVNAHAAAAGVIKAWQSNPARQKYLAAVALGEDAQEPTSADVPDAQELQRLADTASGLKARLQQAEHACSVADGHVSETRARIARAQHAQEAARLAQVSQAYAAQLARFIASGVRAQVALPLSLPRVMLPAVGDLPNSAGEGCFLQRDTCYESGWVGQAEQLLDAEVSQ